METENNKNDKVQEKSLKGIEKLADEIQAGDKALNKLRVQNLDFILDIPLRVTVELGKARVVIKDLLQMAQGSVVELDKLAGEPLDVYVNGKMVARGEVDRMILDNFLMLKIQRKIKSVAT